MSFNLFKALEYVDRNSLHFASGTQKRTPRRIKNLIYDHGRPHFLWALILEDEQTTEWSGIHTYWQTPRRQNSSPNSLRNIRLVQQCQISEKCWLTVLGNMRINKPVNFQSHKKGKNPQGKKKVYTHCKVVVGSFQ